MKTNLPFPLNQDYPDGAALAARFPSMFNKPNIGFGFYRGWQPILAGVCVAVDGLLTAELGADPDVFAWTQIKEKFGSARLYFRLTRPDRVPSRIILLDSSQERGHPHPDWEALSAAVDRLVDAAEIATISACMACGAPARASDPREGWITTLCPEHRARTADNQNPRDVHAFWDWVHLPGVDDNLGQAGGAP